MDTIEKKLHKKIPDLTNIMHRNPDVRAYVDGIKARGQITRDDWATLATFDEVHIMRGKMNIYTNPNPFRW